MHRACRAVLFCIAHHKICVSWAVVIVINKTIPIANGNAFSIAELSNVGRGSITLHISCALIGSNLFLLKLKEKYCKYSNVRVHAAYSWHRG